MQYTPMRDNTSDSPLHIKQNHLLFGSRELVLQDDQQLLIRENNLLRTIETTIPLEQLEPNPSYAQSFSIKWLAAFTLMIALGMASLFLAQKVLTIVLVSIAFICFAMAALFGYRFLLYTTNLVIFRDAQSHEYILYLWRDKPNAARFSFFVEELNQRLLRIKQQHG